MGNPDNGIPDQEKFSTSAERREFSRAVNFDPQVEKAIEIMDAYEPSSKMDQLLDQLTTEQKKSQPDQSRFDDLRRQLTVEHELIVAQSLPERNPRQYLADQMETKELNDQEAAIHEIEVLSKRITGLDQDISEMADDAVGDMAEVYPDEMRRVLDDVEYEIDLTYADIAKTFGDMQDIQSDQVMDRLQKSIELQRFDFMKLHKVFTLLKRAEIILIDAHTKMLKAVDAWRKEHQQKS